MTPAQFERVSQLFEAACELDASEQRQFVEQACQDDDLVFREVIRMLEEDARGSDAFPGVPQSAPIQSSATDQDEVPDRIGGYRVVGVCGHGGMGTVYEAEQDYPRRRVALKVIRSGAGSQQVDRRFRQEAEILGRLQHPSIAQIFEAGTHNRQPFLAMEFVDGLRLDQFVAENKLDVPARLDLFARICDGVHYAHLKGIVHRDLKPANVLVSIPQTHSQHLSGSSRFPIHGEPKILDFGIARLTDSDVQATTLVTSVGELVGTVGYMSPEQASGDPTQVDIRSDIYALGMILFELLADRKPYELGASMLEAVRVIQEDEPPRLGSIRTVLRGDIETIVGKCLEKDPGLRYQSAADLSADIRRHLSDEPILARAPSAFYQVRKFTRRHRLVVGGVISTMLALIIGAIFSIILAIRASDSEALARYQAYRSSITAASGLVHVDPFDARKYLDEAPAEHRNWEWHYLSSQLAQRLNSISQDVHSLASPVFLPDGKAALFATASGEVHAWDLKSDSSRAIVSLGAPPASVTLSKCGRRFAALHADGRVVAYDLSTRENIELPQLESLSGDLHRYGMAWDEQGSRLAMLGGGFLSTIDLGDSAWQRHAVAQRENTRISKLEWMKAGDRLVAQETHAESVINRLIIIDATSGQIPASHEHAEMVFCFASSPDGRYVAVGYGVRSVVLLDANDLTDVTRIGGHLSEVKSVTWSEDASLLITSGRDNTIRVWDVVSRQQRLVINENDPQALTISPDQTALVVQCEGKLHHWNASMEPSLVLSGHHDYPYHIAFSPDGSLLASASFFESECRLWDPLEGSNIASIDSQLERTSALAFTQDGTQLLQARVSGYRCVHQIDPFTHAIVRNEHESLSAVYQGFTRWNHLHAVGVRNSAVKHLAESSVPSIWRAEFGNGSNGSGSYVWADGELLASHEGNKPFIIGPHPHPMFIGSLANIGYHFRGYISEIMLFDNVLDTAETKAMEAYLDARRAGRSDPFPITRSAGLVARFVADEDHIELDDQGNVIAWRAINDPSLVARGVGNAVGSIRFQANNGCDAVSFKHKKMDEPTDPSERRLQLNLPTSVRLKRGSIMWLGHFTNWGYAWGLGLTREASPEIWPMMRQLNVDLSTRRLASAHSLHPGGSMLAVTGFRGGDNNGAILLDEQTGMWIDELG
ncbi:MAG: protein kinase domain-containing protein, partial [Phycisphaerae bacterium]